MATVSIIGGGVVGLGAALLLAKAGHEVTVLERDPDRPRANSEDNWKDWQRRGVNQFRLPHFFLARYRQVLEAELPEAAKALEEAGAVSYNVLGDVLKRLGSTARPDDDRYRVLTARRPVAEAALASVAESTAGVTLRRGVAVTGLVTGPNAHAGTPHVAGVSTADGEELRSDLVVDMSGRRSALPRWLADIGARPPVEEVDDSGFMYYARHFRSADGPVPEALGPLTKHIGTITTLNFPSDNGTWAVAIVTSAKDKALYGLRDAATWERVVRSLPLIAHWADGEPLEEVTVISKIEDRYRGLVVDGEPVVTGLVALADAWACTNPTLGRGTSMGMMHAVLLRDTLGAESQDDPWAFANAFHRATAEQVEPWYRATVQVDRHRLAEIEAGTEGQPYRPEDPSFEVGQALRASAERDPECLRALYAAVMVLEPVSAGLSRPGLMEKVMALGADWRDQPLAGPDRAQLLSIVAGGR